MSQQRKIRLKIPQLNAFAADACVPDPAIGKLTTVVLSRPSKMVKLIGLRRSRSFGPRPRQWSPHINAYFCPNIRNL